MKLGARLKLRRELKRKRQEDRIYAKDAMIRAKDAKKYAAKMQKVYGSMSPEEVNALNQIQPVLPKMAEELKANNIPVADATDAVEVATKYANYNPQIEDVAPQEVVEQAYGGGAEGDNFDDFDRKKAKGILGSLFVGVVSGVKDYIGKAKMKPEAERTPSEQRLIDSEKGIVGGAKKAYINDFMGKNGILIIAVLAVIVFYKKIV
jgi:hypothetical protein